MNGKLIYGVGAYEKGKHKAIEGGRKSGAYVAWHGMLKRCYDPKYSANNSWYIDCTVCDEWLSFQSFAEWYAMNRPQDDRAYHLDKDLKIIGNRTYSPSACMLISGALNSFVNENRAARGDYLIGVHWDNRSGKLRSNCRNPFTKKKEHLGLFTDELSAHMAWRERKSQLAYELAMKQTNSEVRDALLRWKLAIDNNDIHTIKREGKL